MSDMDRLRKLAGIKEKPVLTEIKPVKKTLVGSVKKSLVESDEGVVESTTEYDLSISTDTFGQYKSKPLEPDFPADMGEKFSKFSSGETNDAIGDGEDGFGKEEGAEQPKDSGSAEGASGEPKEDPKAKFKPKGQTAEPKTPTKDDSTDDAPEPKAEPKAEEKPEEPEEDNEFSKKVKEAQDYYRVKHFIRSHVKESGDYSEVFMAAINVIVEQAETLIVKYGANLTQQQEKFLAMDIAKDLTEGLISVKQAAQTHGAKGRRNGSTYTFEFTDTASALMFTNYLAEATESVSVLAQNRGFIEAKVRDFASTKKIVKEDKDPYMPHEAMNAVKDKFGGLVKISPDEYEQLRQTAMSKSGMKRYDTKDILGHQEWVGDLYDEKETRDITVWEIPGAVVFGCMLPRYPENKTAKPIYFKGSKARIPDTGKATGFAGVY